MTTPNGRSTESRRSGRSVGQWLLGLLIVLAIVASILMVFSDQLSVSGSIAVIAALWAAVIGAILVTKFRRQAESAESKSRDLRLVYELQLEREIAARRQYELDVETTIRKELTAETGEELAELKAQVIALRSSLEVLLGESLPDPRVALPSEKLRELASGLGGEHAGGEFPGGGYGSAGYRGETRYRGEYDSVLAARDFAATAPATDAGRHVPSDVDPNEMTEIIPIVTDDAPISGRIATEVHGLHEAHTGPDSEVAGDVTDAEVTEEDVTEAEVVEPSAAAAETATGTESGIGEGADEQGETPAVAPHHEGPPVYVDETPTDEWMAASAQSPAEDGTAQEGGSGDSARADIVPGRHETSDDTVENTDTGGFEAGGRRRRRVTDDGESAHSAGLPVSELLSQLRDAGAPAGRRRRED